MLKNKMLVNNSIALPFLVILTYIILILLRSPTIIWPGRFWAEEGAIYFSEAYTRSIWDVLTTANIGYYSLLNKLASITAAHTVPLQYAPVITMLFAMVIQILPAYLLLFYENRIFKSLLYKTIGVALILFCQPNQEVWLNTINSQFFLCISSAIILFFTPSNKPTYIAALAIVMLAGLTGVVSCFLLPLFFIEYLFTKNKFIFHASIVLTLTSVIQGYIAMAGEGRTPYTNLSLLTTILFNKQWIFPILGSSAIDTFLKFIAQHQTLYTHYLIFATSLPYMFLGAGLILYGQRESKMLFFTGFIMTIISIVCSAEAQVGEQASLLRAFSGDRYFYAPNVLIAFSLLMPLKKESALLRIRCFRLCCITLVIFIITTGFYDFIHGKRHLNPNWLFSGYSWSTEVENWQRNETGILRIWPEWWEMYLPKNEIPINNHKIK